MDLHRERTPIFRKYALVEIIKTSHILDTSENGQVMAIKINLVKRSKKKSAINFSPLKNTKRSELKSKYVNKVATFLTAAATKPKSGTVIF